MYRIVTPVSHLFLNNNHAKRISRNSDYLEIRERTIDLNFNNEIFFHCDHDITLPWSENFKSNLSKIIKKKNKLKYITFQSTRCCLNEKFKKGFFSLSGKKFTKNQLFKNAKKNVEWFREKFSNKFLLGLENNNYYPSKAYDIITDPNFISDIVKKNKLFFLFDIAHAKVTASNRKIDYKTYLNALPLDLMLQIHICRPKINDKLSKDTHYLPDTKLLVEVKELAKKYKKLKFFTFEYYKEANKLINVILKFKRLMNEK